MCIVWGIQWKMIRQQTYENSTLTALSFDGGYAFFTKRVSENSVTYMSSLLFYLYKEMYKELWLS